MKRKILLFTGLSLCLPQLLSAQSWDVNGNNANPGEFVGTINNEDLRFRVNDAPVGLFHSDNGYFGVGYPFETYGVTPTAHLMVASPDDNTHLFIGRVYDPDDCIFNKGWTIESFNPNTGAGGLCSEPLSNSRLHFSLTDAPTTMSLTYDHVGIKQENPTNDLTILSSQNSESGGGILMRRTSSSYAQARFGVDNPLGQHGLNVQISPDNGGTFESVIFAHKNLNVGIGNLMPTARVHVQQLKGQTRAINLEFDLNSDVSQYYSDLTYLDGSLKEDVNWIIRGVGHNHIGDQDNSEDQGDLQIWSPEMPGSAEFLGPEESDGKNFYYGDIRVGIGTKSPNASLHILQRKNDERGINLEISPMTNRSSRYMDILFTDPDLPQGGSQRSWVIRASGHGIGTPYAGLLSIWSPETSGRVAFLSSGDNIKVGIGTANPNAMLHIGQMANITKAMDIEISAASDANHKYSDVVFTDPDVGGDNRGWIIRNIGQGHSSGDPALKFVSPNVDGKVVFQGANGNDVKVAIGNSVTPGDHSLYVDGSIIAEEVFVKLSGNWPDFVFSKDHELMNLDALKQYVHTEGHLPNIPSQEEVDSEGGVASGEIIRLQMQKIEELTLYIIELNERLAKLEHNNQE